MLGQYVKIGNEVYERDMDTEAEANFDSEAYKEMQEENDNIVKWWEYNLFLSKLSQEEFERIELEITDESSEEDINTYDMIEFVFDSIRYNEDYADISMRAYQYHLASGNVIVTRETMDLTKLKDILASVDWYYDLIKEAFMKASKNKTNKYYNPLKQ